MKIPLNTVIICQTDIYPLGLPSLCGILMETAFSNAACRTSSEALKARLFTTSVLQAAPVTTVREGKGDGWECTTLCYNNGVTVHKLPRSFWTLVQFKYQCYFHSFTKCPKSLPATLAPFWLFSPTKSIMMDLPCTSVPWASSSIFSASASVLNST